jgi:acyl-CoA synthetase (AMP-forming)/AMP-acid ligase II
MHADFLLERFRASRAATALVWRDRQVSYGELLEGAARAGQRLAAAGVPHGAVVALEADFSPEAVCTLLALIDRAAIIVPLTSAVEAKKPEFLEIAEVEWRIVVDGSDATRITRLERTAAHPLLERLRESARPGLVLFSSGSTGKSKAALHDLVPMLEKFKVPRQTLRSITFLLFDHIGGFNTLFYNLSNGGCIVTVVDRRPETVCAAIERHRVQLLPTSPTFLNLLLISESFRRHDLSSLELVTYGTEVMPESTLRRFHAQFPGVKLQQTYGLSEVGILRSKSRSPDSLWVKVGGEGFETRVVDGMLEIKAKSAMLGYLNAPSPFTDDGWFRTGDAVEVDGEYLRILGRKSELINVGGEKVYPAEVESVLQCMPGVLDVAVAGAPHPLTGQIVVARVQLNADEPLADFRMRMRSFCRDRLAPYKVPQKVEIVRGDLYSERYKKMRRLESAAG